MYCWATETPLKQFQNFQFHNKIQLRRSGDYQKQKYLTVNMLSKLLILAASTTKCFFSSQEIQPFHSSTSGKAGGSLHTHFAFPPFHPYRRKHTALTHAICVGIPRTITAQKIKVTHHATSKLQQANLFRMLLCSTTVFLNAQL